MASGERRSLRQIPTLIRFWYLSLILHEHSVFKWLFLSAIDDFQQSQTTSTQSTVVSCADAILCIGGLDNLSRDYTQRFSNPCLCTLRIQFDVQFPPSFVNYILWSLLRCSGDKELPTDSETPWNYTFLRLFEPPLSLLLLEPQVFSRFPESFFSVLPVGVSCCRSLLDRLKCLVNLRD